MTDIPLEEVRARVARVALAPPDLIRYLDECEDLEHIVNERVRRGLHDDAVHERAAHMHEHSRCDVERVYLERVAGVTREARDLVARAEDMLRTFVGNLPGADDAPGTTVVNEVRGT